MSSKRQWVDLDEGPSKRLRDALRPRNPPTMYIRKVSGWYKDDFLRKCDAIDHLATKARHIKMIQEALDDAEAYYLMSLHDRIFSKHRMEANHVFQMMDDLAKCTAAYKVEYADIIDQINAEKDDSLKEALETVVYGVRLPILDEAAPTQPVGPVLSLPQAVVPTTATDPTAVEEDDGAASSTSADDSTVTAQKTTAHSDHAVEGESDIDFDYLNGLQPNDGTEPMGNHSPTSESLHTSTDRSANESA
ncbi:uncharacterized protein N7500_005191 [Penicillium coprophilum]|uniref:uncharacterized protein n=1 Tax=Penicillium coprophilum TaxID=36646 RepID=UPI00238C56D0|nr:uncharacterized protein N7500_005191 [Penicillium coprophilum]KAJ5163361.1 hypothetical protein N7500_005191 [Penicillium coprophilum]